MNTWQSSMSIATYIRPEKAQDKGIHMQVKCKSKIPSVISHFTKQLPLWNSQSAKWTNWGA